MSLKQAREEYQSLLDSGDLNELFPMLCGDWQKDKDLFIEMFMLNRNIFEED